MKVVRGFRHSPSVESDEIQLPSVEDRLTEEIVVGFVGPVGSGVSTTSDLICDIFAKDYGYRVNKIKISEIIGDCSDMLSNNYDTEFDRIRAYQDAGNKIREERGADFLAKKAVERIASFRSENDGYIKDNQANLPKSMRWVHVIDSLKHPKECKLLQSVYSEALLLFGIFAPQEKRRKRLIDKGLSLKHCEEVMEIDEDEPGQYGQKVRKTIELADFFIRNDRDSKDLLREPCERFIDLVFGLGNHSPSLDEKGMVVAKTSSTASACLSRQVGAAIYSSSGELLGAGANDVPKANGGLYKLEDHKEDKRCFRWKEQICHNDHEKSVLIDEIINELKPHIGDDKNIKLIKNALGSTRLKDLIEFSRAVHAEMEAIVSVARSAKQGIVGGTMYTTTFPCHSCARHIVASGIARVIFIEAYPKSLALKLHDDSICTSSTENGTRVKFLQFEGVSPKNIVKFFGSGRERKRDGRLLTGERQTAKPIADVPLDGFSTREDLIVNSLVEVGNATH